MSQPFAGYERTRFSSSSRPCRIEASSFASASPGRWGRCSNRSICLRLRAMNARHSGLVIVSKFSEKRRTFDPDINTSRLIVFRKRIFTSRIIAKPIPSAKQIDMKSEARRGQCCDIFALCLWQARHIQRWCIASILDTRCRNATFADFPFELCKGDLSIRLFCSTGCVRSALATTTFSASEGRP